MCVCVCPKVQSMFQSCTKKYQNENFQLLSLIVLIVWDVHVQTLKFEAKRTNMLDGDVEQKAHNDLRLN